MARPHLGEAAVTMIWRILAAAVVTLGLGAGTWAYEAWPSWYGQEITLRGQFGVKDARSGRASIDLEARRLKIEGPRLVSDDLPVPAYLVKQIDTVWPAGDDPERSARLLQRRVVYLQMERQSEGYVPVSVSRVPVAGAINLQARVLKAQPNGRFEVTLTPPLIPIPAGIDENVFVSAVLRVLPSGRHAIVRLTQ